MTSFLAPHRFRRPSTLQDRFHLPGIVAFCFSALVTLWLFIQTQSPNIDPVQQHSYQQGQLAAGALCLLSLIVVIIGEISLRNQIFARELRLQQKDEALTRERHGLETCIRDRTAELRAEVEERTRAEQLNTGRNQVLELLARNHDANSILEVLLQTVVAQRTVWGAALHQLQGSRLVLRSAVGIPRMVKAHLQTIDRDFLDAPEAAALQRKGHHIIEDMTRTGTPIGQLLAANGLYSALSVPFFSAEGDTIGVCTIYSRLRARPSGRDHELVEMACSMAAVVLEHERLHLELMHHAYADMLTGLPNRRVGESRLDLALDSARRDHKKVAILWLDLDCFKQINDTYGHAIGDLVLQETANRLSRRIRDSDSVARMGGDEFMIVARDVQGRDSAELLASAIHNVLADPFVVGGVVLAVSTSIGVAVYPLDGETTDDLKRVADDAMYHAKSERSSASRSTPHSLALASRLRELRDDLSHAVQHPDASFEVHYQPQCDFHGRALAFEALLRYPHSRQGSVSPATFIPLAEQMGLIVPLGDWVLRHVCNQIVTWQRDGYPAVTVAVNISPLQFARTDFAAKVALILQETGLAPELLELELTESLVMNDVSESARQLNQLSALGVSIAIDDFGTGHSSLSCLHQLPINVLKIDRSFVQKLTLGASSRPIVDSVISMAHKLGLQVVAEGVETREQLDILEQDGCNTVQGFFFSPALPASQAIEYLRSSARGTLELSRSVESLAAAPTLQSA